MSTLLLFAGFSLAHAADLDQGWYLAGSGRAEQATHIASQALQRDPQDLEAHRLYLWSLAKEVHDGPQVEAQYRAWVDAEPDNVAARVTLATLLTWRNDERGAWCQEVQALVEPPPEDQLAHFYAIRARYEAGRHCPGDQVPDRKKLIELSKASPQAEGYGLQLRLVSEPVDEAMAADLKAFYAAQPELLAFAAALWGVEPEGPQLQQARSDALEAARQGLASESPVRIHAALHVFQEARDAGGIVSATQRCLLLDPDWLGTTGKIDVRNKWAMRHERQWTPWLERIDWASRRAVPKVAVQALRDLDERIPQQGLTRAYYQEALSEALDLAGQEKAALKALYQGWQSEPSNGSMANAYAYTASMQGRELGRALKAIDTALIEIGVYDPESDPSIESYDQWTEKMAHLFAARLDTRAWLLHLLGHHEEAAAEMRRVLLVAREKEPIFELHMGLIYAELGQDGPALEHLGRGLAMGDSDEPGLDEQARQVAEALFAKRRWAAGGLDAWVKSRLPDGFLVAEPTRPADYRVGESFPDVNILLDEEEHVLSFFQGLRVVYTWASSCKACRETLDALDQLAIAYEPQGVQVFVLSADERPFAVQSYWEGAPEHRFIEAWAGREALEATGADGLSTAFVIDGQGVIQGCFPRFRGAGDERLAQRLDALLKPPSEGE